MEPLGRKDGQFANAAQGAAGTSLSKDTLQEISFYMGMLHGETPGTKVMKVKVFGKISLETAEFIDEVRFSSFGYPDFLQHWIQQMDIEVRVGNKWSDIPGYDGQAICRDDSTSCGVISRSGNANIMAMPMTVRGEKNPIHPKLIVGHELGHLFDFLALRPEFMAAYEQDTKECEREEAYILGMQKIMADKSVPLEKREAASMALFEATGELNARKTSLVLMNNYFLPSGHKDIAAARKEAFAELFGVTVKPEVSAKRVAQLETLLPRCTAVMREMVREMGSAYKAQHAPIIAPGSNANDNPDQSL